MYFRNKLSLSYLIYYVLYTELVTGEGRVDLFPWIQFTNYTWVPCTVFYLLCTMHYVLYTRACYWRGKSWPDPLNTVHKLYMSTVYCISIYYVLCTMYCILELVTGERRVDLLPWIQFTNYTRPGEKTKRTRSSHQVVAVL